MTKLLIEILSLVIILISSILLFPFLDMNDILLFAVITGVLTFILQIYFDFFNKTFNLLNAEYWFYIGIIIFLYGGMLSSISNLHLTITSKDNVIWCINLIYFSKVALMFGIFIYNSNKDPKKVKTEIYQIIPNFKRLKLIIFIYSILFLALGYLEIETKDIYGNVVSFFTYTSIPVAILSFILLYFYSKNISFLYKIMLTIIIVLALFVTASRTPVMYFISSIIIVVAWDKLYIKNVIKVNLFNPFFLLIPIILLAMVLLVGGFYKSIAMLALNGMPFTTYTYQFLTDEKLRMVAFTHVANLQFADAFYNFVAIKEIYYNNNIYLYGESIIATIFNFIPRFIWPDKPGSFGAEVVFKLYPQYAPSGMSIATSLIGELLVNLGRYGTILAYFIIGLFIGKINQIYGKYKNNLNFIIVYSNFLFLLVLESRGDILTINVRGMGFILFLYFAVRFGFKKIKLRN